MKRILPIIAAITGAACAQAQTEANDSTHIKALDEVVVEARMQSTSAAVSTYIPTSKQKNSAQSGTELLNRMAIPQLSLSIGDNVTTASGKPVDIFIDYLPASEQDLAGMRMTDVKKVEYYDYPDDPRFDGKAHVVNFIMQKYEYGGYLKTSAREFFIANSGQLNLYTKFQYRRMTYDLAVGGYYNSNDHTFSNSAESYRLPQPDGTVKEITRLSETTAAATRRHNVWPTFKALYRTDNITISNTLGADFDYFPKENNSGKVTYLNSALPATLFSSEASHNVKSIVYSGNWSFILPHGNSITFNPYYSYSHTNQTSIYTESGAGEYVNNASDNSHRATGNLRFKHNFGSWGDLTALCNMIYQKNSTRYTGTADAFDRQTTLRIGPGVMYSYNSEKFYGMAGAGLNYDRSRFADVTEESTQPWVDLSLQYSFNSSHSANIEFHHMTSIPSSSYRSAAIIQSNPFMSYTGNPAIRPYKSYDLGASYLWMPSNKFRLSVYGNAWIVDDRYAYVYEASATGILRTIQQPMGSYAQGSYGVSAMLLLLDNKLQINGQAGQTIAHNGAPYNWTKSHFNYSAQAFYYLDNWHFGLQYVSDQAYPDGCMVGTWMSSKSAYSAIAGWGNSAWNFQTVVTNPFRWNWHADTSTMKSEFYDMRQNIYNSNYHCYILVSATYTFGFGKKIQVGNEASQQSGAASGILR